MKYHYSRNETVRNTWSEWFIKWTEGYSRPYCCNVHTSKIRKFKIAPQQKSAESLLQTPDLSSWGVGLQKNKLSAFPRRSAPFHFLAHGQHSYDVTLHETWRRVAIFLSRLVCAGKKDVCRFSLERLEILHSLATSGIASKRCACWDHSGTRILAKVFVMQWFGRSTVPNMKVVRRTFNFTLLDLCAEYTPWNDNEQKPKNPTTTTNKKRLV